MVIDVRVLQVSATDIIGGAGIAAYRLHQGLRKSNIDSQMLVMRKATSDPTVHRISGYLNRLSRMRRRLASHKHKQALKQNPRQPDSSYWSLNHHPYSIASVINSFDADAIHLHWVGDNFLPIQELNKINAPIVWTLHDMWALTGGCHYSGDCTQYQTGCGTCPQLIQPQPNDISDQIIQRKIEALKEQSISIVTPSQWLADCAHESRVLHDKSIQVIPNGINTTQFKPIDRRSARTAFNLPYDKKLVLFGAFGGTSDPRKGFKYLQSALKTLSENNEIELVVFGAENSQNLHVNLPVHQVGRLQDSVSIALLYSACDVFVLPSMQDNFPNTILESLACGTPCVGFDTGGLADLIQHKSNGYLAKLQDIDDLAKGIRWVLAQSLDSLLIHDDIFERYALPHIVEQYHQLYVNLS